MSTRNLAVPVRFQNVTIDPKTFTEYAESQRKLKGISEEVDAETQAKREAAIMNDLPDTAQLAANMQAVMANTYQGNFCS